MMRCGPRTNDAHGIALLITLVAISLFSVVVMALALSSSVDRLGAANHDEAAELLNLVEAALALTVRDLSAAPDWNSVLAGAYRSPRADGPSDAVVYPWPGTSVDLPRLTHELTCGNPSPCTDPSRRIVSLERPWGANNGHWRPFLYGRLALPTPLRPHEAYVVAWVADDGSENDGDPYRDGGGPAGEGRYILRARVEAFGRGGGRRAIEADLARICTGTGADEVCLPGIRVLGWRLVSLAP